MLDGDHRHLNRDGFHVLRVTQTQAFSRAAPVVFPPKRVLHKMH